MSNCLHHLRAHGFCVTCIVFGLLAAAHAQQTGERLVRANDPAQITDAVMITDISVGGNGVQCGLFVKPPAIVQPVAPFHAPDDWLKTMTISLFNRTNKNIVAGQIALDFLDTGDCRALPCAVENIHLGHMPTVDAYNGRTGQPLTPEHPEKAPLDWRPDQTMTVRVGDYMDEIEKSLENHLPATAVTKVAVHIGAFFFEDGMRAFGPFYSVPDRDHPGKVKYLPHDYFPGRRDRNWPPGYDR